MRPKQVSKEMEYKIVIVIRDDLRLSPGKLAAQVAHASVSCALKAKGSRKRLFSSWLSEGQRKVVLKVKDLAELEDINRKANSAHLITEKITDAGLTEVPP
ncbi:MAG: aminoacyl-tRNA hydrolase, partial [Thermoplasmata archaeon]|nr:aminoacyl-tRNA hydrolase [Thermoplasmata archaeon]